jgi:hypothetical protein
VHLTVGGGERGEIASQTQRPRNRTHHYDRRAASYHPARDAAPAALARYTERTGWLPRRPAFAPTRGNRSEHAGSATVAWRKTATMMCPERAEWLGGASRSPFRNTRETRRWSNSEIPAKDDSLLVRFLLKLVRKRAGSQPHAARRYALTSLQPFRSSRPRASPARARPRPPPPLSRTSVSSSTPSASLAGRWYPRSPRPAVPTRRL